MLLNGRDTPMIEAGAEFLIVKLPSIASITQNEVDNHALTHSFLRVTRNYLLGGGS